MMSTFLFSILIFVLIFISAFAMYLPLVALANDKVVGLRYAIPFSVSVEILFGYAFYNTGTTRYFPISYLILVILANIWAYYRLRPISYKKPKISPLVISALLLLSALLIFTRYFDAFSFIGPGGNDVFYHLNFVKDLFSLGYLSNGFYAPGFHLFLMPVADIVPFHELYRFAGPAIGVVTAISFVLVIKDFLKHQSSIILLLALLALPIYNQLILQTIYFFASVLSFIYFPAFIFLLTNDEIYHKKINYYLIVIFSATLAITVPYLLTTIIPASIIVFFIVLSNRKKYPKEYIKYLFLINLIFVFGFILSFGHVFIQSKILNRYYGFPGIAIIINQPDKSTDITQDVSTEVPVTNDELADQLRLPRFIANNPFLKPMIGTSYDMLRIKYIRPSNTVLGFGAYLWIVVSLFLVFFSLRKKNTPLLIISVMSIFYGLCTQTGLFEMSTYRGRSGWYLMMLSIFGFVLFLDQVFSKKIPKQLIIGFVLISITGFFLPPKFNRHYHDEEFEIIGQIAKQYPKKSIKLITSNYQLGMVSENLTPIGLDPKSLEVDNSLLILEKAGYADINAGLESEENFQKFDKYFENTDFIIYKNIEN